MKYWLHPGAREDLREAAEFYRERAGNVLTMSLLEDFEHAAALLLQHPSLGPVWRHG
jgi:plasmid stabilization system protein ParE